MAGATGAAMMNETTETAGAAEKTGMAGIAETIMRPRLFMERTQ